MLWRLHCNLNQKEFNRSIVSCHKIKLLDHFLVATFVFLYISPWRHIVSRGTWIYSCVFKQNSPHIIIIGKRLVRTGSHGSRRSKEKQKAWTPIGFKPFTSPSVNFLLSRFCSKTLTGVAIAAFPVTASPDYNNFLFAHSWVMTERRMLVSAQPEVIVSYTTSFKRDVCLQIFFLSGNTFDQWNNVWFEV